MESSCNMALCKWGKDRSSFGDANAYPFSTREFQKLEQQRTLLRTRVGGKLSFHMYYLFKIFFSFLRDRERNHEQGGTDGEENLKQTLH